MVENRPVMDGCAPMVAWTGQLQMREGADDMPRLVAEPHEADVFRAPATTPTEATDAPGT